MTTRADRSEPGYPRDLALLCCPTCRGPLTPVEAALRCEACVRGYPIDSGVIRFADHDDFYEGAYLNHVKFMPNGSPISELGLYLINTHYLWWVRRFVREDERLLELGCGSGVRFFGHHARATGLDISFASTRGLDPAYELAIQGDALRLPFADRSHDAVVSSYFWEHIGGADRPRLLAEIRRVLRPGGRVIFLFDVASYNPLYRFFRSQPEKFQECFVEHDHHYGLETATANIARFEAAGFRVLDTHLANKTPIQHLPVYAWAKPYGHPLTDALAKLGASIGSRGLLAKIYGAGVTLMDDIVEPFLPANWSRIMLVALEA